MFDSSTEKKTNSVSESTQQFQQTFLFQNSKLINRKFQSQKKRGECQQK
jgi:hypothetical protein